MLETTTKTKYGKYVVYLYFIEGLVCKSTIRDTPGLWLLHMAMTVALIFLLILIGGKSAIDFNWRQNKRQFELLGIYFFWSLVSSFFSVSPYSNLIYSLVSCLSIYVCVHIVAYLSHEDPMAFVLGFMKIIIIWLFLGIIMSFIIPDLNGSYTDYMRFRGVSANATESGIVLSIGLILIIWYMQRVSSSKFLMLCLILSSVAIILTRKRGALLGLMIALPLLLQVKPIGGFRKYNKFIIILLLLVFSISPFVVTEILKSDEAMVFLRVTKNDDTRSMYFSQTLEKIQLRPLLGYGPMSKFGNSDNVTENNYNIDSDPHNTWLCLAQYFGFPGVILFFVYLLTLIVPLINSPKNIFRPMIVSFMAWGMVWAMISEWLMSFGTPGDRLSFMILGIGLASLNRRQNTIIV